MIREPIIAVSEDFLNLEKMESKIPVVLTRGRLYPGSIGLFYTNGSLEEAPSPWGEPLKTGRYFMADCDGDALWVIKPIDVPNLLEDISESYLDHLQWKEGIDADGQKLLTTAIVDVKGYPLGVAYSSLQSAKENFIPKRVIKHGLIPHPSGTRTIERGTQEIEIESSCNILTLRSRSRGIWPKGLKNPNKNKDAPLPETLELSSGNYLLFRGMRTNKEGDALLIWAEVPEGHGFCHESYLCKKGVMTIYKGEAPKEATPYRSCFHRIILPSDFLPDKI